jgi:hypothetical protein
MVASRQSKIVTSKTIQRSSKGETMIETKSKPHLVFEARAMILRRLEKYTTDYDHDLNDADRWERHAINAVQDLVQTEKLSKAAVDALRALLDADGHAMNCGFKRCTCGRPAAYKIARSEAVRVLSEENGH